MKTVMTVSGMTCEHCKASVSAALERLDDVSAVAVDLQRKRVEVTHGDGVDRGRLREAVEAIGFDVV